MIPTDSALVEEVLNGNKDAFEEIVKRHQDRVYGLALARMRDRTEAEDLAQETFVQAYRKLSSYNSRYEFRNWLLAICANQGKNLLRSRTRRQRAYKANLRASSVKTQELGLELTGLPEAINAIPEKLRVPLVLKHVEGFSYEEVGSILKISTSAAKMRVKRGRDQLVQYLGLET